MCLPSHLPSSSVRCAIHTSYIRKKGILFLILVPPTPSPLLSCLPSHLASSSVTGAIHTSYLQKMASSFWFSSPQPPPHYFHASPPTWQVLLLEVPFILLIWKEIVFLRKENYKSAKCNIAFELKWLLVSQKRIHLLTEAENGRNSRPEWLIPRCISTSYHTMVSPKNLSQITALNH